jgi:hypothetical protein
MNLIYKWLEVRGLTQELLGLLLCLRTTLYFKNHLLQLLYNSLFDYLQILEGEELMQVNSKVDRKQLWHQGYRALIRSSDRWIKLGLFWMLLLLITRHSWGNYCQIRMDLLGRRINHNLLLIIGLVKCQAQCLIRLLLICKNIICTK